MHGLMQRWELTLDRILDHAKQNHGAREVVTREIDGSLHRTSYADLFLRAKRVSNALRALGVQPGDRIATLAFNSHRHVELWYGAMAVGVVCHTLNPRLLPAQIAQLIRHAGDRILFVDANLAPVVDMIKAEIPCVSQIVFLGADAPPPAGALSYEALIALQSQDCAWGGFSEDSAAGLCYTSGTTGEPKGVLYSHRSNFLMTYTTLQADVFGLTAMDAVLAIVPMFHANGWGLPFAAPAAGAKLVLPGARLDGASIHDLLEGEGVTISAAVPTVWQGLLQHLDAHKAKLTTLKRVIIGGSACPESLMRAFYDRYGVETVHAWGMTETSPLGTLNAPHPAQPFRNYLERFPQVLKQGRAPLGVELKLVAEDGKPLPHDGVVVGALRVRGPAVAASYHGRDEGILDEAGFFDTGDIASIDPSGFMQITDRAKDLIKSGGEWISSIELENVALLNPNVAQAAVIGVAHPKWSERPLLVVQLKPGAASSAAEILAGLEGRIAKWWTPDEVVFVDEFAMGPTGKIDKKTLRAQFAEHYRAT